MKIIENITQFILQVKNKYNIPAYKMNKFITKIQVCNLNQPVHLNKIMVCKKIVSTYNFKLQRKEIMYKIKIIPENKSYLYLQL
jgi:hypothetical protein